MGVGELGEVGGLVGFREEWGCFGICCGVLGFRLGGFVYVGT